MRRRQPDFIDMFIVAAFVLAALVGVVAAVEAWWW